MQSILIAHRDVAYAEQLAMQLRASGYYTAHPDVPMLLAWSPKSVPDGGTLRAIRAQAPHVRVAAHEPAALARQIQMLLAHPVEVVT